MSELARRLTQRLYPDWTPGSLRYYPEHESPGVGEARRTRAPAAPGTGAPSGRPRQAYCKRDHPMSEARVLTQKGRYIKRDCRKCRRIHERERYARLHPGARQYTRARKRRDG